MMPRPHLVVADDPAEAAVHGATLISAALRAAIEARGIGSVAVSGGQTPLPMFRQLAGEPVSWPDVHVWQVDERAVPLDHPARTWTHVCDAFVRRVPTPIGHLHPMPVDEGDLATAAAEYAALLRSTIGVPPVLDVVHLGLGADGHTASLVSGDPVLEERNEEVSPTKPYQGHRRMTLTGPAINRARHIVWLVLGEDKAAILRRLYEGDTTIPAGRINPVNATIVADRAAAAGIDRR